LAWLLSGLGRDLPTLPRAAAVVVLAVLALLRDGGIVELRLPQPLRQVPRSIFTEGLPRAALRFGFELGTGVRTYITSSLPYLLLIMLLLTGPSYGLAVLAGVGFGLGRAVVPLLRLASRRPEGWDRRMSEQARWLVAACATLSLMAVIALVQVAAIQ
jgi:hypothetical protein